MKDTTSPKVDVSITAFGKPFMTAVTPGITKWIDWESGRIRFVWVNVILFIVSPIP